MTTSSARLAEEVESAHEIRGAYEARDGRAYRLAVTRALMRIKSMSRADLDEALVGYRSVAAERGGQGLESILLAAIAELADRYAGGAALAREHVVALGRELDFGGDAPVHARTPVSRPRDPLVHHIPVIVARSALTFQIEAGVPDLETALEDGNCDDAYLDAMTARYGEAIGEQLRAMCRGGAGTWAVPSQGGRGLGGAGMLSAFECMLDHEPTRAERFDQLMDDCVTSMGGDASAANPFANGSVYDAVFPLRETNRVLQRRDMEGTLKGYTMLDASDAPIVDVEINDQGEIGSETYYNDAGEAVFESDYQYDASGSIEKITISDSKTGKVTWEVSFGKDANGDTTVDVVAFDENGNPIPESQGTPSSAPGPDGWGETPECAMLTLFLVEDRLGENLMGNGTDPPPSVINPDPQAPVVDAGEDDCLNLTGGMRIDDSFECHDELVSCDFAEPVDGSCACSGPELSISVSRMCAMFMDCGDAPIVEEDGTCTCGDPDQEFVDDTFGGDPSPGPGPDPSGG